MRFMTSIVATAFLMMTGTTWRSVGQQAVASNGPSEPLKAYLRSYLSLGGKVPPDTTTRVTAFSVKTDDGRTDENIVYVSGQGFAAVADALCSSWSPPNHRSKCSEG